MPTNAEIKAAIDLIIRQPHNHILTGAVADILDDIVDNISAGPGGTPGIDDVLAEAQDLTADRTIALNGKSFNIQGPVGGPAFEIIPYTGNNLERSTLSAHNATGSDNLTQFQASTTDTSAEFSMYADYQDGTKLTEIEGSSEAGVSTITYTADTHTFNINGVLSVIFNDNNFLLIDPTVNDESAAIQANNITGAGNLANVRAFTDDTSAGAVLLGTFNNDKQFSISGSADASGSSLTYTADDHIFSIVQEFADNAAAVTGGKGVGTLYRTGDALKIVHV